MEEKIKIDLRRQEHTLSIIGLGVILFGFWTIIRATMEFLLNTTMVQDEIKEFFNNMDPTYHGTFTAFHARLILLLLTLFMLSIELGVRLYIGRSAIAVGRGKNKSILYLIAASLLCIFYILSFISYTISLFVSSSGEVSLFDKLVYLVIDITSVFTLVDMIISGIQVRILRKKLSRMDLFN